LFHLVSGFTYSEETQPSVILSVRFYTSRSGAQKMDIVRLILLVIIWVMEDFCTY
jgi:hypothetical protein